MAKSLNQFDLKDAGGTGKAGQAVNTNNRKKNLPDLTTSFANALTQGADSLTQASQPKSKVKTNNSATSSLTGNTSKVIKDYANKQQTSGVAAAKKAIAKAAPEVEYKNYASDKGVESPVGYKNYAETGKGSAFASYTLGKAGAAATKMIEGLVEAPSLLATTGSKFLENTARSGSKNDMRNKLNPEVISTGQNLPSADAPVDLTRWSNDSFKTLADWAFGNNETQPTEKEDTVQSAIKGKFANMSDAPVKQLTEWTDPWGSAISSFNTQVNTAADQYDQAVKPVTTWLSDQADSMTQYAIDKGGAVLSPGEQWVGDAIAQVAPNLVRMWLTKGMSGGNTDVLRVVSDVAMFLPAFSEGYKEGVQNGLSDAEARANALTRAAIETGTEHLSDVWTVNGGQSQFDEYVLSKIIGSQNLNPAEKYIAKSIAAGIGESIEEIASSVSNDVFDTAAYGTPVDPATLVSNAAKEGAASLITTLGLGVLGGEISPRAYKTFVNEVNASTANVTDEKKEEHKLIGALQYASMDGQEAYQMAEQIQENVRRTIGEDDPIAKMDTRDLVNELNNRAQSIIGGKSTEVIEDYVNRLQGNEEPLVQIRAGNGEMFDVYYYLGDKTADQVKALDTAERYGLNAVIVDELPNAGDAVTLGDGTILISADSKKAAQRVVFHEIFHALRSEGTWNGLLNLAFDEMNTTDGEVFSKWFRDLVGRYAPVYGNVQVKDAAKMSNTQLKNELGRQGLELYQNDAKFRDVMDEEVAANYLERLGDEDAARAVFNYSGDIGNRIWQGLNDAIRSGSLTNEERTLVKAERMFAKIIRQNMAETRNSIRVADDGSVYQDRYSRSTWVALGKEGQRQLASEIAKQVGVTLDVAQKWMDDINSVAAMIGNDASRLDFIPNKAYTAVKTNDEYLYTVDMSTLCKKRILLSNTIDEIQRMLPGIVLTGDDYIRVREMMKEKGYEVSCGFCYVESRRKQLGNLANQFIDALKGRDVKMNTKQPAIVERARERDSYIPTLWDLTSAEGSDALMQEHPEIYSAFVDFNATRGSGKVNLIETRTEYNGEIAKFTQKTIDDLNARGGLRLQSYSDFETPHLIDMMQVVADMSRMGLMSQAFTKVPNFADAFGDTGIKINESLVVIGVDENGKLIFDDVEGMPHETAFAIRQKHPENVGTIIVGKNDETILAAFADPRIDFIIPFHKSGWANHEYEALGIAGYDDYTDWQNERDAVTGKGLPKNKGNILPSEYWDYSVSGDENAKTYLRMCEEQGRIPKFDNFLTKDDAGHWVAPSGYWKTLIDFKMYDNDGVGVPQRVVTPTFDNDVNQRILDEYEGDHNKYSPKMDIVNEFIREKGYGERYSLSDDYAEKFTDRNGRVFINDVNALTTSDWKTIQKAVDKLGYGIGSAENAKNAFSRYADYGFNAEQSDAIRRAFGVAEQKVKNTNPQRANLAKQEFGTTGNFNEAGYLLQDGKMLDFSGKREGGAANTRAMDHREINRVFDEEGDGSASWYMNRFIDEGNIRLMPERGVTIGEIEPTSAQYNVLKRYIEYVLDKNGDFGLDISNEQGYTVASREYGQGDKASRIINDIKEYFKNGELPYRSQFADFRYSLNDEYMDAVNRNDMDEADNLLRQWALEQGYDSNKPVYHGTSRFGWTEYKDNQHEVPFIYTSDDPTVAAHYAGDNNYAFRRNLGKQYSGASDLDSIIQGAKSVWDTNYRVMTDEDRQNAINDVYTNYIDDVNDKLMELQTDNVNLPTTGNEDEDIRLANVVAWIPNAIWTAEGFRDDITDLQNFDRDYWQQYSDSLTEDYEMYEKDLPLLREYYSEHRDELNDDTKKYLQYLMGYDLGDAVIYTTRIAKALTDKDMLINDTGNISDPETVRDNLDQVHNIGAYTFYGNYGDNPYRMDANGSQFWAIQNPDMGEGYHDTDSISKWASDNGFTSILMDNVYDYGDKAQNNVFFNPSQIKLADTVTYDDNGNVIPLDQRYNPDNPDIRYALGEQYPSWEDVPEQEGNWGYHAGDLGKAEPRGSQGYSRGTGHFGTGTYFVGNPSELRYGYSDRPVESVDFSQYNLFNPQNSDDAYTLHEFLKAVDGGIFGETTYTDEQINDYTERASEAADSDDPELMRPLIEEGREMLGDYFQNALDMVNRWNGTKFSDSETWDSNTDEILPPVTNDELLPYGSDTLYAIMDSFNEYGTNGARGWFRNRDIINRSNGMVNDVARMLGATPSMARTLAERISTADLGEDVNRTDDSRATRFMKALGYEGVDTRNIPDFDNTRYGSVIYDLKGNDLERKQANGARFSLDVGDNHLYQYNSFSGDDLRPLIDGMMDRPQEGENVNEWLTNRETKVKKNLKKLVDKSFRDIEKINLKNVKGSKAKIVNALYEAGTGGGELDIHAIQRILEQNPITATAEMYPGESTARRRVNAMSAFTEALMKNLGYDGFYQTEWDAVMARDSVGSPKRVSLEDYRDMVERGETLEERTQRLDREDANQEYTDEEEVVNTLAEAMQPEQSSEPIPEDIPEQANAFPDRNYPQDRSAMRTLGQISRERVAADPLTYESITPESFPVPDRIQDYLDLIEDEEDRKYGFDEAPEKELSDEDREMYKSIQGNKSGALQGFATPTQMFNNMVGKTGEQREFLRDRYERPMYETKKEYNANREQRWTALENMMKETGIQANTPESAAVQWYGEKVKPNEQGETVPYTLNDLKREFPDKWEDIVKMEQFMRGMYDEYVGRINAALEQVYPNLEEKAQAQLESWRNKIRVYQDEIEMSRNPVANEYWQNEIAKLDKKIAKLEGDLESGEYFRNKRLNPRQDYFHHFQEVETKGIGGLKNILQASTLIDPQLVGKTEFTKPKSRWMNWLQKRGQGAYTADAVLGMGKYIDTAEYAIAFDPLIAQYRDEISNMVKATRDTKNANQLIQYLSSYTNQLAGKTASLDRTILDLLGEGNRGQLFNALAAINNRAKSNAVVGNVRSAIAQFFNIPNAMSIIKSNTAWAKGVRDYANAKLGNRELLDQSPFLQERYFDHNVDDLKARNTDWEKITGKIGDITNEMMTFGDREATELIWLAAYNEGIENGVSDPTYYADDLTRQSVAGRGIGEVPYNMKSKVASFFMPFQVETNNQWQNLKGMLKDKDAKGVFRLMLGAYLMNAMVKPLFNDGVLPDIIDVLVQGLRKLFDKDREESVGEIALDTGKRMAGEAVSFIPGTSLWLPAIMSSDSAEALFGDSDPTRYGTGTVGLSTITKTLADALDGDGQFDLMTPLLQLGLPYGGKQASRLYNTLQDMNILPSNGTMNTPFGGEKNPTRGDYSKAGALKYQLPEEVDSFGDAAEIARAFLFGSNATNAAQEYFDTLKPVLNKTQVEKLKENPEVDPQTYIDYVHQANVDGKNGINQAEAYDWLSKQDLSDEERNALWSMTNSAWTKTYDEYTPQNETIVENADTNGDGRVTQAEAYSWLSKQDDISDEEKNAMWDENGWSTSYDKYDKAHKGVLGYNRKTLTEAVDQDGNGMMKQQELYFWLQNQGYTEQEKADLWDLAGWKTDYQSYNNKMKSKTPTAEITRKVKSMDELMGKEAPKSPSGITNRKELLIAADSNNDGYMSQKEAYTYLSGTDLSEEEKEALWNLSNWKTSYQKYKQKNG